MQGILSVIKPENCNSTRAVSAVRRITGLATGHMGTLDPMASGVLPIAVGKATRLFPFLTEKQKTYEAEFVFGEERDTLDATGQIIKTTAEIPSQEALLSVIPTFLGDISQVPPAYSACFVNGKRGYALARKGVEFTLSAKTVHIENIEYLGQTEENKHRIRIACGGGTYIRSLIRDIGYACGSLATMTALCRTQSGIFTLENGVKMEDLTAESIASALIPPEKALSFPTITLNAKFTKRVIDGLPVNLPYGDGIYTVFGEDRILGVGEITQTKLKIKAYLREDI